MNWIKQNALTVFGILLTAVVSYSYVQFKVDAQEKKIAELEYRLRSHEADYERHVDKRFLDGLITQFNHFERRLSDLNSR